MPAFERIKIFDTTLRDGEQSPGCSMNLGEKVRMARKLLPGLRRRSLDYVSMHYGVEITRRHRAGGDAAATAQVFLRMIEDVRREGCRSWHDLQRLLIAPTPKRRKSRRPPAMPHPIDKDTTA